MLLTCHISPRSTRSSKRLYFSTTEIFNAKKSDEEKKAINRQASRQMTRERKKPPRFSAGGHQLLSSC
jgi:hypothetical protein